MFKHGDRESEFYSILRTSLSSEERILEAAHDPELVTIMEYRGGVKPLPQNIDVVAALEKVRYSFGLDAREFDEATTMCHTLVQEGTLNG